MQRRVRLLLEGIEQRLRTGKSEKMQLQEKLTIEHLLPQEWRARWPLPVELESEQAAEERDRILHTMGNLTLLNKKLNPAVSNGTWEDKWPEILKHTLLQINKDLEEYLKWDEATIRIRGEKLFDTARSVWPRPRG